MRRSTSLETSSSRGAGLKYSSSTTSSTLMGSSSSGRGTSLFSTDDGESLCHPQAP